MYIPLNSYIFTYLSNILDTYHSILLYHIKKRVDPIINHFRLTSTNLKPLEHSLPSPTSHHSLEPSRYLAHRIYRHFPFLNPPNHYIRKFSCAKSQLQHDASIQRESLHELHYTMFSPMAIFLLTLLLLLTITTPSSASLLQSFDPATERLLDPFRVLEHIPFELDRADLAPTFYPTTATVNWKETPTAHEISIDVPGMKKDELKIEVLDENRVLRVSGERRREEEKKGEKWHRVERAERFWRQFRLPENADLGAVKAKLEDGVLTVTLPKLAIDKVKGPRTVSIVGGDLEKESLSGGGKDAGKKVEL